MLETALVSDQCTHLSTVFIETKFTSFSYGKVALCLSTISHSIEDDQQSLCDFPAMSLLT